MYAQFHQIHDIFSLIMVQILNQKHFKNGTAKVCGEREHP